MAQRHDEKHSRAQTRIEADLPAETVAALDSLAAARGMSRADMLAILIADAAALPATATPESSGADTAAPSSASASESASFAKTETTAASSSGYRFRRPRTADEQRYRWIAEADDGTRIALSPDPALFYRWRGVVLGSSLYIREAKGDKRDEVVARLLDWP